MRTPSQLEDYLFDLRGFVIVDALDNEELSSLNAAFDEFASATGNRIEHRIERGGWIGNAQRRDYTTDTGFELHNVLDCGDARFDVLIDHPSWIQHARHWAGEEGTYVEGVTIDENIASIRVSGGHHPAHSGGHDASVRTQYRYANGRFRCGQLNVLVALTDIGKDDGPTMVVPGSHKANLAHPLAGSYADGDRMDDLPAAIPVELKAGQAVLFVDSIMHGAQSRLTATGERRVIILRYGPPWSRTRFGYEWSTGLLERLSPPRRFVLQPVPPIRTGDLTIPVEAPHRRPE